MASNNRKMFYPYQPEDSYTLIFNPYSLIYPPPPPPPPPPPLQRDLSILLSTSICIIGSVLLILFLTIFLYLYIMQSRRRRSSPAAEAPGSTNRREEERDFSGDNHHVWRITALGLHRSEIDSITVVVFKEGEWIIDGTDCSVCLNEFEEDESLRLLPKCSHAFHINCIDMWLLSHKNCPLCRAPVFPTTKNTETNHQTESGSSSGQEDRLETRDANVLLRTQSDLASGMGRLEPVRRSFSIGGSSLVKAECSDDNVAGNRRRQFYSSFSANFFSSSRRTRNQDSVLPTRIATTPGYTV